MRRSTLSAPNAILCISVWSRLLFSIFNESQQNGAVSRIFAHHVCLQHVYSAPANQTSSFLILSILQKINNFDYSSSWYWPDQAKQTNWKRLGIGFGVLNISCHLQECRLIRRRCQSQHVKPIINLKVDYTRKEEINKCVDSSRTDEVLFDDPMQKRLIRVRGSPYQRTQLEDLLSLIWANSYK